MSKTLDTSYLGTLVERAQKGDEAVHGEIIDLTQNALFKFCLLLSQNKEVAEDICQETLIKALQGIHKLQNPKTFLGWMYQIARNLFIDFKRSAAHRKTVSEDQAEEASASSDLDLMAHVQKTLHQFDPDERFLLLLIELEGYSYKEAGEMAGLSEDAVRSKLHRLRQLFIQRYKADK